MTRRHRHRGQALVETALIVPLLLTLFLGVYSGADLLSDKQTAGEAARAGARVGAEIGNNGYPGTTLAACQSSATDPCAVDQQIVQNILPILRQKMDNVVIQGIDIYQPDDCAGGATTFSSSCPPDDGQYQAGERLDQYDANGNLLNGSSSTRYTLDLRTQRHPNEALIGVRIRFHFHSPTPVWSFDMDTSEYAVMRLAAVFQ